MTIDFETFAETAEQLQTLAAKGAPAVHAQPNTAPGVVRRVNRQRRFRSITGGAAGLAIVGALAAGALVGHSRYFDFIQPSEAMAPTIAIGDIVTLDKTRKPTVGDVVLVRYEVNGQSATALWRYAGDDKHAVLLPGVASVAGACAGCTTSGYGTLVPPPVTVHVPAGSAYLLGDNEHLARDSRAFGPLPVTDILGVAIAVHSPGGADREIPRSPTHSSTGSDQVDPPGPVATTPSVTK